MEEKREVVDQTQEEQEEQEVLQAEESRELQEQVEASEAVEEAYSEEVSLSKQEEAEMLINEARTIVANADNQTQECKLLLSDDLSNYEEAKASLLSGGLEASEALLIELAPPADEDRVEEKSVEESTVVFESKEELAPMFVRDVSSGKFTGFLLGLIGAGATVAGMAYFASDKLGQALDFSKVPTKESIDAILGWFGTLVGMSDDINVGGAVVGLSALVVMVILYKIRVSKKATKNLAFAVAQLEEAEEYALHKGNCKNEMDRVDAHINDSIKTLNTYRVLLNEQVGKLQRILYIEGKKEEGERYHEKSIIEMNDTQTLLQSIHAFMATPMSQEGKLASESVRLLQGAKNKMDSLLARLY